MVITPQIVLHNIKGEGFFLYRNNVSDYIRGDDERVETREEERDNKP